MPFFFAGDAGPFFRSFAVANGVLAGFHLLPIAPLDGGQALFSLLSMRVSTACAGKTIWIVSFLVLLPLSVLGFWILLRSKYNFSLLFACVYLMLLLVCKRGRFF